MYNCNSGIFGFLDIFEFYLVPMQKYPSAIGSVWIHTGEYLHQCGFACSVFTADCMYRALLHFQRHIIQRPYSGKFFHNMLHLEYIGVIFHTFLTSCDRYLFIAVNCLTLLMH